MKKEAKINTIPFSRLLKAWAYQVFLPLIKRWNKIEFYFVKPFNRSELLAEITFTKYQFKGCSVEYYEFCQEKFKKVKVLYPDNQVRIFSLNSWLSLGEDILKLNNIKIKRYGHN